MKLLIMKIETTSNVKELISTSIKNSISYTEYRQLVEQLVSEESTTGELISDDLINYTKLNDRRMRRWDKTVKVSSEHETMIKSFDKPTTWLVITESWCGDAAHVVPVINKVAELNDNIEYRVVLRDENEALMNAFLT